jgi:thiol:disulfide interchange protein DsbA
MKMLISQQTRRDWLGATLAGAALAGLPSFPVRAHAPVEGVEFKTLARPQPVEAPAGKVEVIEFFGYWCPHCHALEPELMAWRAKQPADVYFRKLPVAFRPNQAPFQHAFFALDALGKADATAPAIFAAIHVERKPIETIEDLAEVVSKVGVDRARFLELAASFAVQAKARRVMQTAEAFAIDGVPCLGVAGKWTTSPTLAGSREKALHVLDDLIARERTARR